MRGIVSNIDQKTILTEETMMGVWTRAAGKRAAKHSRPVQLKKSKLIVNVENSSWLYELTLNRKKIVPKLDREIARLTDNKKTVKDIQLRIGEV